VVDKKFIKAFGSALQLGSVVLLVALIPYTLFAGFSLYIVVSSWTAASAGPLVYAMARFVGCLMLIYALWRLRQTGLRLRKDNVPRR
jgi:hypothetical protein